MHTFSFDGERAFAMVVDVPTAIGLDGVVFELPAQPLCGLEVLAEDAHPHGVVTEGRA